MIQSVASGRRDPGEGFAKGVTALGALLALLSVPSPTSAQATAYYVSADAGGNGNGSKNSPFVELSQAQSVSAAGDTIDLLAGDRVLDGGIALKTGQKLLGIAANGQLLANAEGRVRLSNTTQLVSD